VKRLALPMLFLAALLRAEEPTAAAVRSIATAPVGVTDVGYLDLELGGSQYFGKDGSREGGMNAQLDLGLSSWLDLRIGWTGHTWWQAEGRQEEGPGDPYIGGQLLLASQDKAGLGLGLAYSHLLPRGDADKGLSSGFHEDTLLLQVGRSLGRWALDANLGIHRTKNPETLQRVNQKVGSFAITYAPANKWNLTLDTHGVAKSELGDRELGSILALGHDLGERLKVDLSVERGWAQASPRFAFNAGLIYRIGKIWGK